MLQLANEITIYKKSNRYFSEAESTFSLISFICHWFSILCSPSVLNSSPPEKKKQKEGTHKIKTVYELLLTLLLTFDEVYVYCNKVQRCRQQTQNFLRFHVKPSNSINIDFAKTQFKF